ncbi:hypothetical protein [Brachybacterium sp. NPDC056505]|uniref:hypothetical protein n=1 Tax=Brachybacterium sp. NPDC056505 TaxID=3345843 RepID=UPI00366F3425
MDTVGHPGSRVRTVHPERTARRERDRIRAGLLLKAPGLERRIVETSSGSLLVRFPAAPAAAGSAGSVDGIEIGRLPDRGDASWVVVVRRQDRASVRRCATVEQVVRSALIGLRSARAA